MHIELTQNIVSIIGFSAKFALAAMLLYAVVTDVQHLRIPNAISLAVTILFFFTAAILSGGDGLWGHLTVGAIALCFGFCLFSFGLVGAGDVKLISALMLWAGPSNGTAFLAVMTVIGGVLAAIILIIKYSLQRWPTLLRHFPSRRLRNWATRGIFPYSMAISSAGLLFIPLFFSR